MSRMRRLIMGLSVGVVCCVTALAATAQDAKEKEGYWSVPINAIELKPPAAIDATKSPVEFPHSRHFIYNCIACHHTWKLDARLQTCTASECHDQNKAPKKESGVADINYFKKAFHQKCIGCHLEIKRQNAAKEKGLRVSDKKLALQKSGPTGCVECHPK
ncbi:MAG: cytochrome c3 family protein [Thermodesulfobacteriota bacterium]